MNFIAPIHQLGFGYGVYSQSISHNPHESQPKGGGQPGHALPRVPEGDAAT